MWEAIKNAVTSAREVLGIELPELSVDVGSVGDAATSAAQGITDPATGALDSLTATADLAAGEVTGVAEAVSGLPGAAVDSVTALLTGLTDVPDAGASR